MTIESTVIHTDWMATDGVQVNWPYEFTIFEQSDVRVDVRVGLTGAITEWDSNLALYPTDDTEGYVKFPAVGDPLVAGSYIRIRRRVGYTQDIEIGNEGSFNPELHERAFDKATLQMQQLENELSRIPKLPIGELAGEIEAGIPEDQVLSSDGAGGVKDSGESVASLAATLESVEAFAAQAAAARNFAQQWASEEEDEPVTDGVNPAGYSAYHYSLKALAQQLLATASAVLSAQSAEEAAASAATLILLDEDDMASDSAVAGATQQSIKAYTSFRQRGTGTVTKAPLGKMQERFSALDHMDKALADKIVTRTATAADAPAITAAFQTIMSHCAFVQAALYVPSGKYYLDAQLVANGGVSLLGDGMFNSKLIWISTAASEGISMASQGASNQHSSIHNPTCRVEGLALLTEKVFVGTALTFDFSASISGGVLIDRSTVRVIVDNVAIQGATALNTDAWLGGIDIISAINTKISRYRFVGYQTVFGDPNDSEFGVRLRGGGPAGGLPCQMVLHDSNISAAQIAVDIQGYEGIYISHTDMVAVDIGARVLNDVSEPQFNLTNCHIAANDKCVELTNSAQFMISGCDFYPNAPQTGDFIGIHVQSGCTEGIIGPGNCFIRPNVTSLYRGIVEDGGDTTFIHGNTFNVGGSVGCVGIDITANAVETEVGHNVFPACYTKIQDASADAVLPDWRILKASAVAISHTGDTVETAMAAIAVPAKSMGPNGALRITAYYSFTNNVNVKTPRLRLGAPGAGLAGSTYKFVTYSNQASVQFQRLIQNRGSENSQVTFPSSVWTYNQSTSAPMTSNQATNTDREVMLSGQVANAADTITLEYYMVEVLYRP